jgi:hypothetical protein
VLQVFVRVGSGFTDAQRTEMLPQLSSMKVESPLHMTDSDGRLVHFVEPRWIVELHGEDLVETSSSSGRENATQVLLWKEQKLEFQGLTACPRLTFATFNQLRPEKSLRDGGGRINQVVERALPVVRSVETGARTIVRREIYAKGQEALRKLVVTHQEGAEIAPYVIYWTDFSSKRTEPLKVDVSAAFSKERMEAICAKILEEKVTRGFERLGEGGDAATPESQTESARKPSAKKKAEASASGTEGEAGAAPAEGAAAKPARRKKAG